MNATLTESTSFRALASADTLLDALAAEVAQRPEATAVVHRDTRISFRELADQARAVAASLRGLGVAPDSRVGLFTEPGPELMAGAWGILAAGGAYLPLSPDYPEERLRYIIEDARAEIILCQSSLTEQLSALAPAGTRIVTVDEAVREAEERGERAELVPPALGPDHLAYVIYTSGSTGKPKGVMIEHRSIVQQMRWLAGQGHLGQDTRILQKTPMSFDAAQWEILAPACGATVVTGAPGIYRDPEALLESIRTHRVTTLQCVPTLLQALVDSEELDSCTSLARVFSGGEALARSLAEEFFRTLPGCRLINLYGPTETTINASSLDVDPATLQDAPDVMPIGTPVDRTTFHILDENLRPVPAGTTGELYIGGVQLARGYLGRPDQTEARFLPVTLVEGEPQVRLYRTGDLAHAASDGSVRFAGRADNQVKLRGFRIELEEIERTIERHDWVKRAAVTVTKDSRTGFDSLLAHVEMNAREAAVMDQGNHGSHHQSKESRLQVRAQLSNPGLRTAEDLAGRADVVLLGGEVTEEQRRRVFARKTYRFYEGGPVTRADVLELLGRRPGEGGPITPTDPADLTERELGGILRWFGQYQSPERLLPKYAYASPGALYATQMYLEVSGVAGLAAGWYYYHPADHRLVLIREAAESAEAEQPRLAVHFVGKHSAIEPVYRNNIREVLEIETGHMLGLFDEVLPAYGLGIRAGALVPSVREQLDIAAEDHYLGRFDIVARQNGAEVSDGTDAELFVQAHPGRVDGLAEGQYRYRGGELDRISTELVAKKHVIAINQAVYERASLGITAVSRASESWLEYIALGRALHRLQMNEQGFGFMSSGYSSKSGNPLPAATRIDGILAGCDIPSGPSYFFVGGLISAEQWADEGMREDVVHMKGPAELIKDQLADFLPDYMLPNKVLVRDALPLTANGKIDRKELAAQASTALPSERPFVEPRTGTEKDVAALWGKLLKYDRVSLEDNFFEAGGNSLIAVMLVNALNKALGAALPQQVLFEHPTVGELARRIDRTDAGPSSRLVRLHAEGSEPPVYCWPGLGGYPMNLRLLAGRADLDRPVYGVQAHGLNAGETPYPSIGAMAAHDIEEIRRVQPHGPYTLWGYSFGARVAFEAAWQLEQAGEVVENLFLIAPGAPEVRAADGETYGRTASFANPAYVTILFSVFAGTISGPALEQCLAETTDEESFVAFIGGLMPALDEELIRRIVGIVGETFEFSYTFRELADRRIEAPITIFKAVGDDYSFLENAEGFSAQEPVVVELEADHYSLLKAAGIDETVAAIHARLRDGVAPAAAECSEEEESSEEGQIIMPHVSIKHLPRDFSKQDKEELVRQITQAVTGVFACEEEAVTICVEPIERDRWMEQVHMPEIAGRSHLLWKAPSRLQQA